MPISSSKEIIPFVNELERRIDQMEPMLETWEEEKDRILSKVNLVDGINNRTYTAVNKAEEALGEISSATYGVIANKNQKLKKVIDGLKESIENIALNGGSGGGGEGAYDPRINAEIDNAVSQVEEMVSDGLKLDYRLREILACAEVGQSMALKQLIMPMKLSFDAAQNGLVFSAPKQEGVHFITGDVTVLDKDMMPLVDANKKLIRGKINEDGLITITENPNKAMTFFYPVKLAFKDTPEELMYMILDMVVAKNSLYMEKMVLIETAISQLQSDIVMMKGANWTVDFSIMKNHQDIVKESITPKGLSVEVIDGKVHATFSYNDHEFLSHHVLEKWDEETKQFIPYDGKSGIIEK